jgi:hypothetical protein
MRARPPAQLVDDHETVADIVSMAKESFFTHAYVRGSENLSGVASLRKHAASAISTINVLASADKLSLAPASKCLQFKSCRLHHAKSNKQNEENAPTRQ